MRPSSSTNKMIYIFLSALLHHLILIDVTVCLGETMEILDHREYRWKIPLKINISTDIGMQFIKLSDRWQILGMTIPAFYVRDVCWFCFFFQFMFSASGVSLNKRRANQSNTMQCEIQTPTKIRKFEWWTACVCMNEYLHSANLLHHFAIKSDYTPKWWKMSIAVWVQL